LTTNVTHPPYVSDFLWTAFTDLELGPDLFGSALHWRLFVLVYFFLFFVGYVC